MRSSFLRKFNKEQQRRRHFAKLFDESRRRRRRKKFIELNNEIGDPLNEDLDKSVVDFLSNNQGKEKADNIGIQKEEKEFD